MLLSQNVSFRIAGNNEHITNANISDIAARPVFFGSNPDPTIGRDEANYQGAVILADPADVTNVTVWYTLEGGDNTTIPLLFGDDGGENLSWTQPTQMVYDAEKSNHSTVAYYNYTFQINSEFIAFYAWYNNYEDDLKIPNIITTGVRINTSFNHDIYTQFDKIDVNISLTEYNISSYGVEYRKFTSSGSEAFENVTIQLNEEGLSGFLLANITHSLKVGEKIEVRGFIAQYDSYKNMTRAYFENRAHIMEITDGTPLIELKTKEFTNSLNVSLTWNATPINSNISAVRINWGDTHEENINNISIHTIYHQYASADNYTISVTVHAGAAQGTKNISVLIDQTSPKVNATIIGADKDSNSENITISNKKEVTVSFTSSDKEGSGIDKIVITTDEGNSIEINKPNGSYTVEFMTFGYHTVTITAYDKAGNTASVRLSFTFVEKSIPKDVGVPVSTIGIITGLIAVAFIPLIRKRRNN